MSVLTTTALKSAPSAAAGVAIATGTPAWTNGAWVEVIPSTAAAIALAGVTLAGGSYSATMWELDIGTGSGGAEAPVGTLRLLLSNAGGLGHPNTVLLPVPLGGIGSGVRVAVRARCQTATAGPATIALLYYETFSSDQVTTSSQVLSSAPAGSTTVSLTPNATAWVNSAWVELIASTATPIGLLGLVHGEQVLAGSGAEYDLGTGAASAETVITTLRDTQLTGLRLCYSWLPGIFPVAAGTRVAVRMRKAGTNTSAHPVALLYYTNVSATAAAVETVQPFVWGPL